MAAAPVVPASPVPAPEPAALSQGARVINTFIAPSKTFADIRRSAQWWLPFLLMVVIGLGLVYAGGQKVGFGKITENQMQLNAKAQARYESMTPEQREQQAKFSGIISYIAIPLGTLIVWLIVAGLEFGTFKVVANADITFGKSLAVVVYAGLPIILKQLLAIVALFAGASADGFTFQNPVASNPAYFMTPGEKPFLYAIATAVDIFTIWTLILTAIGFSVAGKVKTSTSFIIVFAWWVIITLGVAAAFS